MSLARSGDVTDPFCPFSPLMRAVPHYSATFCSFPSVSPYWGHNLDPQKAC